MYRELQTSHILPNADHVPGWAQGTRAVLAMIPEGERRPMFDLFRDEPSGETSLLVGSMQGIGRAASYFAGKSVASIGENDPEMVGASYWVDCEGAAILVYRPFAEIADNGESADARLSLALTRRPEDPALHVVLRTNANDHCVAWVGENGVELAEVVAANWFGEFEDAPTERDELPEWLNLMILLATSTRER